MTINTKHFGEITINDEDVITFDEGLPGFNDKHRFAVVYDDAEDNVFVWLQSVEDGDLCFVLVDAAAILTWYKPSFQEDELLGLDIEDGDDTLIYNVARLADDMKQSVVNLLAPIVINVRAKKGKQAITAGDDYTVRHLLFQ